jgi:alkanesulfonate monooxygenase SsuD/methylene tetrahydromethanopterin reductase-like flavin-dependent oxidoreductase (luciferase family)
LKLGLSLPVFSADVDRAMDRAERAAAAGFDAVFAPDHVFPPGAPGRPAIEAFSLLAAAAAAQPEVGVGVLVTRPYLRPLGILAKMAAGLDHVSQGRAIVGLGLGDANGRAEHDALGLPFPPIDRRTVALEETARGLRDLFAGRAWPGGEEVGPVEGPLLPPADPPVWVGGTSDRVLGVAARSADAWNGWGLDRSSFEERVRTLTARTGEAGRDPSEVSATWGGIVLVGEDRDALRALEAEREAKGLSMSIWRGTAADLRAFRDGIERAGASWFIASAAGPADRLEVIAAALRDG